MAEKTDPTGIAALATLASKPWGALVFFAGTLILGPGAGYKLAEYNDPHAVELAEIRSDMKHLAETIAEVRKIEEAAHPRTTRVGTLPVAQDDGSP